MAKYIFHESSGKVYGPASGSSAYWAIYDVSVTENVVLEGHVLVFDTGGSVEGATVELASTSHAHDDGPPATLSLTKIFTVTSD